MRVGLTIALVVLAAPYRPPRDERPPSAPAGLHGEWEVVAASLAGKPHPAFKPGDAVFVFTADTMTIRWTVKKRDIVYPIKVNAATNPGHFDMQSTSKKATTAMNVGIFKIEGDLLTICFQSGGGDAARPKEFVSAPNSRTLLWKLKRIRK